jgi:integrase
MPKPRKYYGEAVKSYVNSKKFQGFSSSTKEIRASALDRLQPYFEGSALAEITRPMVIAIRDKYWDQPGNCRIMLVTLSQVLGWAWDQGWVSQNVAANIRDLPASRKIARWTRPEIELFLDTAPANLMAVMMLALYTGQRRSDLVKMEWTDYDGTTLRVTQQKTKRQLVIPVHPRLKEHLDGLERKVTWGRQPILLNCYGAPWVPNSLRNAFKVHCRRIGLDDRMLHGVRKTTAALLAEMGCTTHQIASITGHQSLKEVERYTVEAEQQRLAREAINKWHAST